jgi:hypothetical protein
MMCAAAQTVSTASPDTRRGMSTITRRESSAAECPHRDLSPRRNITE